MRIYVGNLSYDVSEQELSDAFGEYGTVEHVNVVRHSESGRSKGFGFVDMPEREEGEEAIHEMDGRELKGRAVKVAEAQEKAAMPGGGRGGFGGTRHRGGPGGRRFGSGQRGKGGRRGGGRGEGEGGGRDRY